LQYFVGIDNGGTMIKAVVFDGDGNTVYSVSNKTPLKIPQDGYNERDMLVLWEMTADAVKRAIEGSNIRAKDILAVGCTGHGKGLYLWGKDGQPAYHAVASTDHRAAEIVKRWRRDGTNEAAKEKTLQNVLDCQPVALLRWLKENHPEVIQNTKWIFEAKDYIRFMLTGEAYAEITDYSGTSLMNLKTAAFDKEILKIFGIEEVYDKLPPIKYSCDACGVVSERASRETGIPKGVPVCAGMFDIDACAIAMGAQKDDDICVITGTWAINEYVSKEYSKSGGTVNNSFFCIPGNYLIEESSPASAGNLEWFMANCMEYDADLCKKDGTVLYEKINRMVRELPPENSDVIFVPFLYGSNAPGLDKACFFGMVNAHTKAHLLRAVFEGVAFCHLNHIDRLLEDRKPPEYIKLAGGVTNSKVWTQMFADVIGIPVKVIDTKELGGLGCAIAGAVCSGVYKDLDEATDRMVHVSGIISPNKTRTAVYRRKYAAYNRLVRSLGNMQEE
jgi:L-xylulokinase